MPSLVCVACGAVQVDPRGQASPAPLGDPTAPPVRPEAPAAATGLPDDLTLEEPVLSLEGLAALGEAGFESELEHLRTQRRRQLGLLVLMGLSGVAFVVLVPLAVLAVGAVRMVFEPAVDEAPELPAVVAPERPVSEPVADPVAPDEEGEEGEEGQDEEPDAAPVDPEPAEEPAPADPVRILVQKGWKVASREPSAGAESFRKALELSPGHPEASYGLGYCMLKLDDLEGAKQHLCVARTSSKADIRRDVDALLANNGLTCSP